MENPVIAPPKRKVSPKPIVPEKKPLPKEWDITKPKVQPTPKGFLSFSLLFFYN
jgi:hypothetical protein